MNVGKAVEILKRHGEDPPAGLDLSRRVVDPYRYAADEEDWRQETEMMD